ncbi:MAG: DedA family protein [Epsilonproteobacteria bacterium]|nr:DedA family protein [Campylobacterota bacterium]NPA64696.1 DedA family protein [Campylobacterota bacterium]
MSYIAVFFAGFFAATFLPVYSEAVYLYYLHQGAEPIALTLSAAVGNTLGSVVNYYIGLKGMEYVSKRVDLKYLKKAEEIFQKWGGWSLLLSWAPVIGDPLTFIAGIFHYDFKKFLILVFIAKLGRYAFLALSYYHIIS